MLLLQPNFEWLTSEPKPPTTEATANPLHFVNSLVRSICSLHFYPTPAVGLCCWGCGYRIFASRPSPPGYCYPSSMFFHHFQKGIVSRQSQKSQDLLLIEKRQIDFPIAGYYLCVPPEIAAFIGEDWEGFHEETIRNIVARESLLFGPWIRINRGTCSCDCRNHSHFFKSIFGHLREIR